MVLCNSHMFVSTNINLSHCKGDGLGPVIGIGEEGVISIDPLEHAGPGKARCSIVAPNRQPLECEVVENKDGTFDVFYTARDEGPHEINLTYGGEKLPKSPYVVTVSVSYCDSQDFAKFAVNVCFTIEKLSFLS